MKDPVAPPPIPPAIKRDWTSGSIIGNLWSLSWPMLISDTLNALGPAVDMIWVGKLGMLAYILDGDINRALQNVENNMRSRIAELRMNENSGLIASTILIHDPRF